MSYLKFGVHTIYETMALEKPNIDEFKSKIITELGKCVPIIDWSVELKNLVLVDISRYSHHKFEFVDPDEHLWKWKYYIDFDEISGITAVIKLSPLLEKEHPLYKSFEDGMTTNCITLKHNHVYDGNFWDGFAMYCYNHWSHKYDICDGSTWVKDDKWLLLDYKTTKRHQLLLSYNGNPEDPMITGYVMSVSLYLIDYVSKVWIEEKICVSDIPYPFRVRQNGNNIDILNCQGTLTPSEEVIYKSDKYEHPGLLEDEYFVETYSIPKLLKKMRMKLKKHKLLELVN
jgi:hypothetical protein